MRARARAAALPERVELAVARPTPSAATRCSTARAPEFIRFVNPGDLRVAREACGACHLPIIQAGERSLMATSAMFWGGAAYNNGILPFKRYILGEAYTARRRARRDRSNPVPRRRARWRSKGILPMLSPLPRWETVPPADIFRIFERGGRVIGSQFPEIGLPNPPASCSARRARAARHPRSRTAAPAPARASPCRSST